MNVDISDAVIAGGDKELQEIKIENSSGGDMSGATFNIIFIMGDATTKSTGNFSPPDD